MLGRRLIQPVVRARRLATPAATSRRALGSWSRSPWLSDKSLYPLLGITAVTVAFGVWFGPMWLYSSPESKIDPIRRRETLTEKQPYEGIPMSENLYKKSADMTKDIYRVTIKDEEGSKPADEMGKRTEGK